MNNKNSQISLGRSFGMDLNLLCLVGAWSKDTRTAECASSNTSQGEKVSEAMSIDQYNENILFGIDTEAKIGIELSESTVLATNDNIYSLPKDVIGELSVYDIYGRVVVNQIANTSEINTLLREIAVTNGIYIYRFEAKNTHFSGKFVYNR